MSIESTVGDILREKKVQGVYSIKPDDFVYDAIKLMGIHNIGALLVIQEGKVAGIITERDYATKIVLENRSSRTTRVREVMEGEIFYAVPSDTARKVLTLMTETHTRHLPVFKRGRLIGIISMGDVVKAVINDQQFMIEQLTSYVTGSYVSRATYAIDGSAALKIESA